MTLPYLDKDDEKMLVQCVVALVCESMRMDFRIEDVCRPEHAAEVIVNVFMKGPIGMLFEEEERAELVSSCSAFCAAACLASARHMHV